MRYIVTPPMAGYNAYWSVHDSQCSDLVVACFHQDMGGEDPGRLAQATCDKLNGCNFGLLEELERWVKIMAG